MGSGPRRWSAQPLPGRRKALALRKVIPIPKPHRLAVELIDEIAAFRADGSRPRASQAEPEGIAHEVVRGAEVGDDALLAVLRECLADRAIADLKGEVGTERRRRNRKHELVGMLTALRVLGDHSHSAKLQPEHRSSQTSNNPPWKPREWRRVGGVDERAYLLRSEAPLPQYERKGQEGIRPDDVLSHRVAILSGIGNFSRKFLEFGAGRGDDIFARSGVEASLEGTVVAGYAFVEGTEDSPCSSIKVNGAASVGRFQLPRNSGEPPG